MKTNIVVVLSLAIGVGLAGCVDRESQKQGKATQAIVQDPAFVVETKPSAVMDVPESITLTGAIEADDETAVSAKIAGRLLAVYVDEGASVSAGQVIAKLDSSDATARLRQAAAGVSAARSQYSQAKMDAGVTSTRSSASVRAAEASVRQAKATLAKLVAGAREEEKNQAKANLDWTKADLEKARTDLERANRLLKEGAISKAEQESAQNRFDLANANYIRAREQYELLLNATRPEDIAAARETVRQAEEQLRIQRANQRLDPVADERVAAAAANLASAQETLNLARNALSDTTVRSAVTGRITGKPLTAGTVVAPGTPIANVVGSARPTFVAEVPENLVAALKPGMEVDVNVSALGDVALRGTLTAIDPKASSVGRLYAVKILLHERIGAVRPGMFATGNLTLRVEKDAVTVPADAVIRDGEDSYLFTVSGGKAAKRKIQVVRTTEGIAVVRGISGGEDVVVTGQSLLVDGAKVKKPEESAAKEESK